ncbi:hypothetical protein GWK47_010547 [Chionoecetes opilio]|uniref:Uncharacterized protein n=1 Tax=Chionoecetes opilio TaxID=41210 RepID=A0A8J4XY01_CHIOP|nr:hypothetical protein GWK47_010547 [Chionoecetes opilio]
MIELGPQEDLFWWEADDCQCKDKDCRAPLVTFKNLTRNEVGGTCGRRSWTAGDGQRMLSFSLFGNNPEYWKGLEKILPEVEELYPGWKVRLYTNPRHYAAALCPLLHRHKSLLHICDVTNLPSPLGNLSNVHPMMWRMVPLGDPQVAAMMVRDTDSQLLTLMQRNVEEGQSFEMTGTTYFQVSRREKEAVGGVAAHRGRCFHLMRDHPQHDVPVLGGMWGARWDTDPAFTGKLRSLRDKMIAMSVGKRKYGLDQRILQVKLHDFVFT